jgi:hypothetical protein
LGSSRRQANATASQSRSTSGSPKTARAQPGFGNAARHQLKARSEIAWPTSRLRSIMCARPTRSPSRSASSSGSSSPRTPSSAALPLAASSKKRSIHPGERASASLGACSIIAWRTCSSV